MNTVFNNPEYGNQNKNLGCSAKEVTAVADRVDGPSFCSIGERVIVNVTANITFNTNRYVLLFCFCFSSHNYFFKESISIQNLHCMLFDKSQIISIPVIKTTKV